MAVAPHRAQLPLRPCPVCGVLLEPLRAPALILLEDGPRFLCSLECRKNYVLGDRFRQRTDPPRASASISASSTDPVLRAMRKRRTPVRNAGFSSSSEWTAPAPLPPTVATPFPIAELVLASLVLLLAPWGEQWPFLLVAEVGTFASLVMTVMRRKRLARTTMPGVLLAPISAAMVAVAAVAARMTDDPSTPWILASSGVVTTCAAVRGWIDARSLSPLDRVLAALHALLPKSARTGSVDPTRPLEVQASEVEVSRIRAGEEVIVQEGDRVPVDGVVRAGDAYVLLHPTARTPVRRRTGEPILAGARVVDGAVRLLALRVGEDRALARPARFGEGTRSDAAWITRTVAAGEPLSGVVVFLLAAVAAVIGDLSGGLVSALLSAGGVLAAVPWLAVRRAAEAPYIAAGATAIQRGIEVADAGSLDRAGRVKVVALCTHGTITEGAPEVVEVLSDEEARAPEAIALAAGAETACSEHPIAAALARFAQPSTREPMGPVRRAQEIPGRGVLAVGAAAETIVVGNRQLLLDEGISVATLESAAERAEARGLSTVFVGIDKRLRALVLLRDEDRPGARAAVQRLIDLSSEVLLLSGDHRGTVEALARRLDVDHVRADLTPDERAREVLRLREGGNVVAVIGRSNRDMKTLAAADVPVALEAAGAADADTAVALTGDDIRDAAAALWLANAARREALRSTIFAIVAGSVAILLAANRALDVSLIALGATAVDAACIPAAARLLRRIELRLPARG